MSRYNITYLLAIRPGVKTCFLKYDGRASKSGQTNVFFYRLGQTIEWNPGGALHHVLVQGNLASTVLSLLYYNARFRQLY